MSTESLTTPKERARSLAEKVAALTFINNHKASYMENVPIILEFLKLEELYEQNSKLTRENTALKLAMVKKDEALKILIDRRKIACEKYGRDWEGTDKRYAIANEALSTTPTTALDEVVGFLKSLKPPQDCLACSETEPCQSCMELARVQGRVEQLLKKLAP